MITVYQLNLTREEIATVLTALVTIGANDTISRIVQQTRRLDCTHAAQASTYPGQRFVNQCPDTRDEEGSR